ncbi:MULTISPECIES: 50S ribosomal protein L15 [Acinetobacter]|uniref:Large ribosomal subunit protein uL15 n=2 Tax=Acinetobacter baylyi TaxID=202950 RepID=RL15_ACIAD|nr:MULTISPECIES: 50S ribosomal protein L15 [Acinetobacter]Q6F7T1.1 RecName: Full=Large ribosomal subunit protein uL15; AltName: Full=50S ribosomal protein L15 [Acinetobacter baylyi ADP1]ENV55140.1 50S ribosomal protein L15 [Acinetobacter baylyi DSM 14961 = CIP 107474]KAF2369496.1 50S ribosomal protein L15 [Acinetobacter baylyi]KAF2372853.1 50S ribosomal protein L15 [Acinetobacter baylyi]KAF2375570.1 50S ribosomal protein L15 [Acinetobacter baylyi]KAF2379899.1 50S ribosomal protein L15 [Acinet
MTLRLNELAPAEGAKRDNRRLGRGIGSGVGKTGGRGVKGQKSRKSGGVRPGFEGGQTAIYRRLPKFGFTSQIALKTAEVRLSELNKVEGEIVSLETLKAANVVRRDQVRARVVLSGEVTRAFTVQGVALTKGAQAAIEAAGGKVEE